MFLKKGIIYLNVIADMFYINFTKLIVKFYPHNFYGDGKKKQKKMSK